jgi:hypothetical protein
MCYAPTNIGSINKDGCVYMFLKNDPQFELNVSATPFTSVTNKVEIETTTAENCLFSFSQLLTNSNSIKLIDYNVNERKNNFFEVICPVSASGSGIITFYGSKNSLDAVPYILRSISVTHL